MEERFYKIGEIAEMLGIEQHTLRYLENSLKLKIKRDERGDRMYSDADIDTFRLVLQLKDKGLNTTAIRMALENSEEREETGLTTTGGSLNLELPEIIDLARKIVEQNDQLLEQNKNLEKRIDRLEEKVDKRNQEREKKIDEFLRLWREEQDVRPRSWLSRLRGK